MMAIPKIDDFRWQFRRERLIAQGREECQSELAAAREENAKLKAQYAALEKRNAKAEAALAEHEQNESINDFPAELEKHKKMIEKFGLVEENGIDCPFCGEWIFVEEWTYGALDEEELGFIDTTEVCPTCGREVYIQGIHHMFHDIKLWPDKEQDEREAENE
jgi:hypothetical protein